MFHRLVSRASYLQQLGYSIKGLLWLQGEADTGTQDVDIFWGPTPGTPAQSTANHTADLVRLFTAIRSSLQSPTLPIVLLQMSPNWVASAGPGTAQIQDSLNLMPFVLPYTATTWSIDPTTGALLGDGNVHYSAAPQRAIGKLAGTAYEAALRNHKGSAPGPLLPSPVFNINNTLQWAPDPQATLGYHVYVNGSKRSMTKLPQPPPPSFTSPVSLITFSFVPPFNTSTWTVQVQAVNNYGYGPLSAPVAFHSTSATVTDSEALVERLMRYWTMVRL
jgi:hypothetical protein